MWEELDFSSLTERERQVVELISQGKSSQEIAIIMGIKPKSVLRYKENAIMKLGLTGTTHPSVRMATGYALEKRKGK
jgi:DNA-binding CsgD family transcriptional regulator